MPKARLSTFSWEYLLPLCPSQASPLLQFSYESLTDADDAELKRLDAVKAEIVTVVGRVQDNTLAALLMAYYVNGKTWEQVCVDIHYSYKHVVHQLHPRALEILAEILDEKM